MTTGFVAYDELQQQVIALAEDHYRVLGELEIAMSALKAIVESRVNMKLNVNNNRRADFVREEQKAFDRAHELLGEYYGSDG